MTVEIKQEYQWNQSWASPIAHTDVNEVVKELREIQEVRGDIKPEYVVESAKNKKSKLHGYFIWDDERAANKYRLQQASELLRRIEVKVIKDGEQKTIRAFEITKKHNFNPASYITFDSSSSSSSRVKQIVLEDLSRAINRLDSFPEYKVVVSWLRKTAMLLSNTEPKDSTETKKEVKPATLVAVS